eukprot:m.74686 g.74686  ORF g.74686 m.74686 type:complete len:292 (-) comp14371_c0_seq8:796-1671(-)
MLHKPEELIDTPSRQAGVPLETEERYRRDGALFIRELGTNLELSPTTFCTGIALYHRFYLTHSHKSHNRWNIAAACLFIGAKAEEQPKKLKDVVPLFAQLKANRLKQQLPPLDAIAYRTHRDKLLSHERYLLQEMQFDMIVDHPFPLLIKYAKKVLPAKPEIAKPVVQEAWAYLCDSYMTALCLLHPPEAIAAAMLSRAASKHNCPIHYQSSSDQAAVTSMPWWCHFDVKADEAVLTGIGDELQRFYDALEKESKKGKAHASPGATASPNPQSPKVAKTQKTARPNGSSTK